MADFIVGDIGKSITITVTDSAGTAKDISAASTTDFLLLKPDDTTATVTASFVTDGTNGQLTYSTVANDIDQAGTWRVQAHIINGGENYRTNEAAFEVDPAIDA